MSRLSNILSWLAALILLLAVYSYFIPQPGPNELSRLNLTMALARDRTVVTDPYCANSIDVSTFEGHCYSDKAIGASLLGVVWWWVADQYYGFGPYGQVRPDFPLWIVTTGTTSMPAALLVLLVYYLAHSLSGNTRRAIVIAGMFGFATVAFPFSTLFYGHQTSAFFGMAAFTWMFAQRARPTWWSVAGAGYLAGWGALTEYSVAIIGGLVGLYMLSYQPLRRYWWAYAVGGLAGISPLFWYNAVAFGAPWRLSYAFVQDPAFAGHGAGLLGVGIPRFEAIWPLFFSDQGLLIRSPFLILAAMGIAYWVKHNTHWREGIMATAVVLAYIAYNAGYYLPLGGGYPIGPRFLTPMLPFLVLGLAFLPRWGMVVAAVASLPSAALMLAITASLPKAQAGDPGAAYAYWLQHLVNGQIVPNWGQIKYNLEGLSGLAPLAILAGIGLACWMMKSWLGKTVPWVSVPILGAILLAYCFTSAPSLNVPILFKPPPLDTVAGEGLLRQFDDQIQLLGYNLERRVIRPGDKLAITMYWQGLRPMDESFTLFIHLLDKDSRVLGSWDTIPGAGAYPTPMWTPGRIVAETYWVWLRPDIKAPTLCRIEVGWYRPAIGKRLVAYTLDGTRIGDSPLLTKVAVKGPSPNLQGMQPSTGVLGDEVELLGWRQVNDTDIFRGRLYWRSLGKELDVDYTVFVQALIDGQLVAQWDSQPRGGGYPTSLWSPGEIVEDWFELNLPEAQRAGVKLIVGMYDLATMERLMSGNNSYVELSLP